MTGECLEAYEIGHENPGTAGYKAGVDRLRRLISGEVRRRVRDASEVLALWSKTQFPHTVHGAPPHLLARLQMGVTAWVAFIESKTHALGVLKRAIRITWKRVGDIGPAGVGIVSASGVRDFYAFLHQLFVGEELEALRTADPPKIVPFDMAQAWRRMRRYKPRAVTKTAPDVPFVQPIPEPQAALIESTGQSMIRAPTFDDATALSLSTVDRMSRLSGLRSTAPDLWAPILQDCRGPALVVGTGSGGIQWTLARLGKPSFGLDLATVIPPERSARTGWVPGDIRGMNTAVLSAAMWNSDGDWYGPAGQQALAEQKFHTVVLDLQSGDRRHGPESLEPLGLAGYEGLVVWRCYPTAPELNTLVSWLRAKGCRPEVFPASSRHPEQTATAPVILRFRYRLSPSPQTGEGVLVKLGSVQYSTPLDPRLALSRTIADITGGLSYDTDLDNLEARLRDHCSTRKLHRDRTDKAQGLMYLRSYLLIRAINNGLSRDVPAEVWLNEPQPMGRLAHMSIDDKDRHMKYLWERLAPRCVGCVQAMRAVDEGG